MYCKFYHLIIHMLCVFCVCTDSGSVLQVQVEVSSTAAKGAKEVKAYKVCMTALKSM